MNKQVISIIGFWMFSALFSHAQQFKSKGYLYKQLSDTSVAIIGALPDNQGTINIPPHVNNGSKTFIVTTVGDDVSNYRGLVYQKVFDFEKKQKESNRVTSVILPNTVKVINRNSFEFFSNLSSINLPQGLKKIGEYAFGHTGLTKAVLPSHIEYVGQRAFMECDQLAEIFIPNSVLELGTDFVETCHRLETVTLPDKKPKFIGGNKIFIPSTRLTLIKGNNLHCPSYIIKDVAIYKKSPWAAIASQKYSSFSFFAQEIIENKLVEWQRQKAYETSAQYQERVSDENIRKYIDNMINDLRKEYIKERTTSENKISLGTYDAYYGAFPVVLNGVTTYVKVPESEAQKFKDNWSSVSVNPQYGIRDDQFAILSCTFKLNGKTYQSAQTYSNDDASNLMASITPMDFKISDANSSPAELQEPASIDDIDTNIPVSAQNNDKTFAVIIGNENYERVPKVEFALNDASVFAKYCQKTLGVPVQNIRKYNNASFGTMLSSLQDIKDITDAFDGEAKVIFYYAGHGIPSETDRGAYLLPVDADGRQTKACLPLNQLYSSLDELKAKNVVVFLDACFSGSLRGEGMLASARGVAIKPKSEKPKGNVIVFSASSDDETAYPYKEKRHGLFTYYLLKELQQTKGRVSLGELSDYITKNVRQQAIVINRKSQTPTITPSSALVSVWQSLNL